MRSRTTVPFRKQLAALPEEVRRQAKKAEVHWYEAHGIGRRKMKIKRFLE